MIEKDGYRASSVADLLYSGEYSKLPSRLSYEHLSPHQSPENLVLANQLLENIQSKLQRHLDEGNAVEVLGPEWSQNNVGEAAQAHADLIIEAYGETYALPNKYPENNAASITDGSLDVYFLKVNNEYVGTACLADNHDGRGELGRAASIGGVGNTIIQDLRILEWLTDDSKGKRYHALFTTLRTAPDRQIVDGEQPMRGGKAVIARWKKMPQVYLSGVAPMYLKHGEMEQFAYAQINRGALSDTHVLFIEQDEDRRFVEDWGSHYGYEVMTSEAPATHQDIFVQTHTPPIESSIYHLVHADLVFDPSDTGKPVLEAVRDIEVTESPFIQIILPVHIDTRTTQRALIEMGFQCFGFLPGTSSQPSSLLMGRVKEGLPVVSTYWSQEKTPHPIWTGRLQKYAVDTEAAWLAS